jgi:hypothetical protein
MTFPKNIPKLPRDLKQNVNWNQTLLNEGEVKLTSCISFLSIEVEHVDCHSSACLTPKKNINKKKKKREKGKKLQNWNQSAEHFTSSFILQQTIHQQLVFCNVRISNAKYVYRFQYVK